MQALSAPFRIRAAAEPVLARLSGRRGAIAGRFTRSFNARVGDVLLNFHTERDAIHPLGILVPADVLEGAENGMPVRIGYREIEIAGHRAPVKVSLAPVVSGDNLDPDAVYRNASLLRRMLALFRHRSSISDAIFDESGELRAGTNRLRSELSGARIDLERYTAWFGGGEGTTPAWDDFATGILLVDRKIGKRKVDVSVDFLRRLVSRTTSAAYWQIMAAADGASTILLEEFLDRFATRDVTSAEIARCMALGHSSGCDILAGMLVYIEEAVLSDLRRRRAA